MPLSQPGTPRAKTPHARATNERVVTELPYGYAVVVEDVHDVPVTTAVPAQTLMMPGLQNHQLIPYPGEGRFHHDIFEKCCDCNGNCFMAWCCPIFPLAQMMERFKVLGVADNGGYHEVLVGAVIWSIVDLILTILTKSTSFFLIFFCGIIACQLRVATRVSEPCHPGDGGHLLPCRRRRGSARSPLHLYATCHLHATLATGSSRHSWEPGGRLCP